MNIKTYIAAAVVALTAACHGEAPVAAPTDAASTEAAPEAGATTAEAPAPEAAK